VTPISHYFSARSLPWIFVMCVITACSSSDSTSVQAPAPTATALACPGGPPPVPASLITETPKTPFTLFTEPSLPSLPQAGAKATDLTFATTILRLTDEKDGNTEMGVQYSYWPAFNGNCSRIHVVGKYAGVSRSAFFTFDPATLTAGTPFVLQTDPPVGFLLERSDMIWSGISPDLIYGHNEVHRLWAYDVASQQYTMIKDFSGSVLPGGDLAQMSKSLDDQVFAFTLTDAKGAPAGYLAWHRGRDQILIREEVPNLNLNELQVDKSGRYLTVIYVDGHDEIFDLAPLQPKLIATLTKADRNSFVHYDSGRGTLLHDYDLTDGLVFSQLATPTVFQQMIPGFWSYATQDDHFSMQADNEGWALSSRFSVSGGPVLHPFDNEIVQIATDGSDRVRRIAHHRSLVSVYEDQPKASMSRDGRYVAFTSNWGKVNVNGRRDVYIVVNIPPAPTS